MAGAEAGLSLKHDGPSQVTYPTRAVLQFLELYVVTGRNGKTLAATPIVSFASPAYRLIPSYYFIVVPVFRGGGVMRLQLQSVY